MANLTHDPDRNPFLTTLQIVRDIATRPQSTAELCERHAASDRQMKRYIAEAKHLGADLQSKRVDGRYIWSCENYPDLKNLHIWIQIQESQSLIDTQPPLFS